jgi:aminoglycoside phosphotransferase (APT) family kinase protein
VSAHAAGVKMHDDQLTVSAQTVRALVDEQFPQWRSLPITSVDSSATVNAIFRIGDRLAARLPLRPRDADRRWLESEAEAARELAGITRFPIPEPVALGEPGAGYPLAWSVQTWLPGVVATDQDPGESTGLAHDLAEFILEVRAIDTNGRTFRGTGRGGDLPSHDAFMDTCFARSEGLLDVPRLRRIWAGRRSALARRVHGHLFRPQRGASRRAPAAPDMGSAAYPAADRRRHDDPR